MVVLGPITSNESDDADGGGDGKTLHDTQDADAGSADFDFKLRAERDAAGQGRLYEVTYIVTELIGRLSAFFAFCCSQLLHPGIGILIKSDMLTEKNSKK